MLTIDQLTLLEKTDTPTICNAIELAQGKRGFNAFTRLSSGNYAVMHQSSQTAMGYARTAKIAADYPPKRNPEDNQRIRLDYYRYMSTGKKPNICVIEDIDTQPVGAFWGEMNTTIHRGFGISGTLTNGAIRDFGCCPEDYQVIGGCVSPSHRFVHVIEIGKPVKVFGMSVKEGDFVHADRHGACVIPEEILPQIDDWIIRMQQLEEIVMTPAKQADFNFDKFTKAWSELEKKRV